MRASLFLIAEAAAAVGQRLYIHGGGITRVDAPMLPWAEQLAFAIRLQVTPDEVGIHQVRIRTVDPDGEVVGEALELPFIVQEPDQLADGEPMMVHAGLTIAPITVFRPGPHVCELIVDGEVLASETLAVTGPRGGPPVESA